uniref:Uncharacterized protein n=1 Tax=Anguilla anguilla TaxID=7936 RepID=A0A0E9UWW0_ANGAN
MAALALTCVPVKKLVLPHWISYTHCKIPMCMSQGNIHTARHQAPTLH